MSCLRGAPSLKFPFAGELLEASLCSTVTHLADAPLGILPINHPACQLTLSKAAVGFQ